MFCPLAVPRRKAVILLALATTACASVPDLGPVAVSRASAHGESATVTFADTADNAGSAGTADNAGPAGTADRAAWPAEGWWRNYRDPQLARLIDEALAGSPDLAAAAARIRIADGYARQAGAALLPSITATGEVAATRLSQNNGIPAAAVPDGWNDTATVGLGMMLDLDLWGGNRAALRGARLEARAARYEAQAVRLALTTGIATAYADLAALHAQRDTLEDALAIRRETLALVAQRTAEGVDTDATLAQARGRVAQTEAQLAETDEALQLSRNAIAALVGTGPDRARSIARPVFAALQPQALPADATVGLIGRRPDIAAARARAEAAAQRVTSARAAFYPNLSLGALAGVQAFGFDNLFNEDSVFASAGPAISLPIFRGGALQGQYAVRRGQQDEAVALYDRQVIAAMRETADALASRRMLGSRLAASRAALADFEHANHLARLRYRQGLSTYLDLLAAEEGVLDSRLSVARLETRAFALDVALVRALGGGFQA